jgi:putative transposase
MSPMRSTQYPEDVILCLLKEAATGTPIEQVCSTAKVSVRTFYRWRAHYGGLTPTAARERNDLLHENARLRALVQELWHKEHAGPAQDSTPVLAPIYASRESSSGRFASVRGKR